MAAKDLGPLLPSLLLLLLEAMGVEGEVCLRYSAVTGRLSTTYCSWGCCGDNKNGYCCEENSNLAIIVGSVAGGLIALAALSCLVALCCVWKGKTTRAVAPTAPRLPPYVISSTSGTSYGHGSPPYGLPCPPPYKSRASSPLPPPYQPQDPSLPPYDVTQQYYTPPPYRPTSSAPSSSRSHTRPLQVAPLSSNPPPYSPNS